jgi:hypothetical protein
MHIYHIIANDEFRYRSILKKYHDEYSTPIDPLEAILELLE